MGRFMLTGTLSPQATAVVLLPTMTNRFMSQGKTGKSGATHKGRLIREVDSYLQNIRTG